MNSLNNHTIRIALAALALFGPATEAQIPSPPQDIAAWQSPFPLVEAIRVAEQNSGGRARKVEMNVFAYAIETVAKDTSAKVMVDSASGKVVHVDRPGLFDAIANLFDSDDLRDDEATLSHLEASPMTLAAAVAAAERETGGRAVQASLKRLYGQTLFKVGVVKDLNLQEVLVDPVSGQVAAAAQRQGKDAD